MRKEAKKNADEIVERDMARPVESRSDIICGKPEEETPSKPDEDEKPVASGDGEPIQKKETKSKVKK